MSMQDLSHELLYLVALRQARASFFDEVVAYAERHSASVAQPGPTRECRKILRSEATSQISEVLFVFQEQGIHSAEAIRGFLHRHNEAIHKHISSCIKGYSSLGISERELQKCTFSAHQIDHIVDMSSRDSITFDQRSLGKILREAMSFETCRTHLIILSRYGLLTRRDYKKIVYILPNGTLEDLYRSHLRLAIQLFNRPAKPAAE